MQEVLVGVDGRALPHRWHASVLSIYSSTTFNPTFGDSDFLAPVLFWMTEFLPSSELILTAPTELFSTLHRKAYFLIYLHRQRTFLSRE
jgi:hypothetical protein